MRCVSPSSRKALSNCTGNFAAFSIISSWQSVKINTVFLVKLVISAILFLFEIVGVFSSAAMRIFMYVNGTNEFTLAQITTMFPSSRWSTLFSFSVSKLSWWGVQAQSCMSLKNGGTWTGEMNKLTHMRKHTYIKSWQCLLPRTGMKQALFTCSCTTVFGWIPSALSNTAWETKKFAWFQAATNTLAYPHLSYLHFLACLMRL